MSKIKHVYLDMDGVIANFDGKCIELFGTPFSEATPSESWKRINKVEDFWMSLPIFDGAIAFINELLTFCAVNDCMLHILSGTPNSNTDRSEIQKMIWLKFHTPQIHPSKVHFCKSRSKQMYADKFSVLIDDRESNIEAWNLHSGHGILHKSFDLSLQSLKDLL